MIAQLRGSLVEATLTSAVIDCSGVGFEVGISGTTAAQLPAPGEQVALFTRFRIANDVMSLYGFASREERTMFDRLVSVSGVGPRMALSVLSQFDAGALYQVVMADDAKRMATVPGVGKKTAQRLILELKSVFAKDRSFAGLAADGLQPGLLDAVPAASGGRALEEARAALLSMGFTSQEADLALDGHDGENMRVEDLLSAALRRLGMDA